MGTQADRGAPESMNSTHSSASATDSDAFARIFNLMVRIEREYGALDLKIADVHPWAGLRRQIFERLLQASGQGNGFQNFNPFARARIKNAPQNILLRNPLLSTAKARHAVVKWERVRSVNGKLTDVLTKPVLDRLPAEDMIQFDFTGNITNAGNRSFSLETILLAAKSLGRLHHAPVSQSVETTIAQIESLILREIGSPVLLKDWFARYAVEFGTRRKLFRRCLKSAGVENLFMAVAYGHAALIAAAHDIGAKVIELQHGLISRYHAGYDYPNGLIPPYHPDVILLFGEYWRQSARHPTSTRLFVLGAPHIRDRLDALSSGLAHIERKPVVLFISQPGVYAQILDFALRFAALPGAPKVIYRLHPSDDENAIQAIAREAHLPADRFEISAGGGGDKTLDLQLSSANQAGAFSTAMVEGLANGCRTFLIDIAGWSSLAGFVESGQIAFAATPEQLLAAIGSMEGSVGSSPASKDLYFAKLDSQAIDAAIGQP